MEQIATLPFLGRFSQSVEVLLARLVLSLRSNNLFKPLLRFGVSFVVGTSNLELIQMLDP